MSVLCDGELRWYRVTSSCVSTVLHEVAFFDLFVTEYGVVFSILILYSSASLSPGVIVTHVELCCLVDMSKQGCSLVDTELQNQPLSFITVTRNCADICYSLSRQSSLSHT